MVEKVMIDCSSPFLDVFHYPNTIHEASSGIVQVNIQRTDFMSNGQFKVIETLTESEKVHVFKAVWDKTEDTVIVRKLKANYANRSDLTRFLREYGEIRSIRHPGLIGILDLVEEQDGICLVLEDHSGQTVLDILKTKRFSIHEFLPLIILMSDALAHLHSKGIVHGNISPKTVLIDSDTSSATLMEYGIDSMITGSRSALYNNGFIYDVLPYLSPEQTGRVNRSVDYRSDFYNLGFTAFEMLTGITPFRSKDPLELIHCHIARPPVSPDLIVPECPRVLCDILLKLMAKTPEERYQSASGLKHDLLECLHRLQPDGSIEPFMIGQKDISPRFIIPQKLYGREREMETLLKSFDPVCLGKNQLMLVSGDPGIGKSALIFEIHKSIVGKRGHFISGKYEQYKSDSPYNAIIQAFKGLLHQILSESEDTIRYWRDSFRQALGPNGGVITEIFPELTLITGEYPLPLPIGPEEARNRFNLCFESFISVFVSEKHPLVFFLDDLQWADFSSLHLLTFLLQSTDITHTYFILSYRSNEVTEDHPFIEMLRNLEHIGITPSTITLGPLSKNHIGQLITGFLKCSQEKGLKLGEQIFKKTAGNPFFVNQFLKILYDKGKITFDPGRGWQWDESDIAAMQVTENVVELMAVKIAELAENTLEILKVSSCIGNRFDIETLSLILQKSMDSILSELKTAIEEGYVRHVGHMLLFHHDRIQEAVYSLISQKERSAYHLRIARLIYEKALVRNDLASKLFYVTDQFNLSQTIIRTQSEKELMFRLNRDSGKKAKSSAAFETALVYFMHAEKILTEGSITISQDDRLALFREIADVHCLNGDYDRMNQYIDKFMSLSPSVLQCVGICEIEIRAHFARQQYEDAIQKSIGLLCRLGVPFKRKVTGLSIIRELIRVKGLLRSKTDKNLLSLPEMTDERELAISKIYFEMGISANLTDAKLYGMIVLKRFAQILKNGQNAYSSLSFLGYGALLSVVLDDVKNAVKFGELAMTIAERPEGATFKYRTHVLYGTLLRHWKDPLDKCHTAAAQAYTLSREAGDQIYTGMALMYRDFIAFLTTHSLPELKDQILYRVNITRKSGQIQMLEFHNMILQLVTHLISDSPDPSKLIGPYFDEDKVVPQWIDTGNHTGLAYYYVIKTIINYFLQRYDEAHTSLLEMKKYHKTVKSMVAVQLMVYFECLVSLGRYPALPNREKRATRKTVKRLLKKITRWAVMETTKHQPWIDLIQGEYAAVTGKGEKAPALFEKSIHGFSAIPIPLFRCLSFLRGSLYYLNSGQIRAARHYLSEVARSYHELGANLMFFQVKNVYGLDSIDKEMAETGLGSVSAADDMDFSSILKSSQALSGQIELDKLVRTIMTLSLESAGAQKGFLILHRKKTLLIRAQGSVDKNDGITLLSMPVDQSSQLALSVVNYVGRTHKPVVLSQACQEGAYLSDPYIRKHGVQSLLASPMISSGLFKGIIYLENNRVPGVFSAERIRILNILASQAAISLENAEMFDNVKSAEQKLIKFNIELEQKVEERTEELKEAYEQIMASIRYSGIIQNSLMTDIRLIREFLPDSFVIWKPRQIVGGDMYAVEQLDNGILVAVIDCTGHGVPGAFMTMLAGGALRRIVKEDGIHEPALILKRLNHIIKSSLHQDKDLTGSDDGLDAGICFYDIKSHSLRFAGACIPLYMISSNNLEVMESGQQSIGSLPDIEVIKGDKQSLGYVSSNPDFEFTTHTIDNANEGTTFYLATDGYGDQLGEKDKKRLGSRFVKDILLANHQASFDIQKKELELAIDRHRGGKEQTDDITFVGFKLNSISTPNTDQGS